MIIGTCGLAGAWNGIVGLRMKVKTVLPSMPDSRCPEATPLKVPWPLRVGPRSTPTVRWQLDAAAGEDEME